MELIINKVISLLKGTNTYIVGGFLRDFFLKNELNNDIDLVTFSSKEVVEQIISSNLNVSPINIGPLTKFHIKENGKSLFIDLTKTQYKDIYQDLHHRDFTCNALALKVDDFPNYNKIIYVKNAISDIEKRHLIPVNKDSLKMDPVRILRGYYLMGKFDFQHPLVTKKEIKENTSLLLKAKGERLTEEFKKILSLDKSCEILYQMYLDGVLEIFIPQINQMAKTKQNGYHTKNLLEHSFATLKVLEGEIWTIIQSSTFPSKLSTYLEENLVILKLACLLHDLGKIDTFNISPNGRITFHRHENFGEKYVREFTDRLKFSNLEKKQLITLCREHMKPLFLYLDQDNITPKSKYKFFNQSNNEVIGILLLSLCDFLSTRIDCRDSGEIKNYQNFIFNLVEDYYTRKDQLVNVTPFLNGTEIQDLLKIPQSPLIGKIKKELIQLQVSGKIDNKDEARKYLLNKFNKSS